MATLVAGIVLAALLGYTLTGGADFGGGVWDLLARGRTADDQRRVIAAAIGPIWEANHVWLILVIVLLFVGFPTAFAAISIALHVPLVLMLVGVVLRGTAFVFRTYDTPEHSAQWSRVFAVASAVTPVMLGACLGAVASGRLRLDADGRPTVGFFEAWLHPFPLVIGLFTLALFALLAAVYLTLDADSDALRDAFRARALGAAVATAALAYGSLALAMHGAPPVFDALTARPWSPVFHLLTATCGLATVAALWTRRFQVARAAVIALVVLVEVGWTAGQLPYVIPPDLTLHAAAAPDRVLRVLVTVLACGLVLLIPAFVILFRVFRSPRA